jgi:hypothetical protein
VVSAGAVPAPAQARASLGVGVGTIRTERGSRFSASSLSPIVRYTTPTLVAQASGFVASLPAGSWAGHGRLHLWGTTRPSLAGRFRLGADGILTGTTRTGGARTAAAHGLGELLWSAPRWGFGLGAGPSTGWIANDPTRFVALHTRARAWWRPRGQAGATEWQGSVEPTRFIGAWFTDLGAGVTLRRGSARLWLSADARLSKVYGSTGAGNGFLQVSVGPLLTLELGAGSYLREPYQGFPRGRFFSLGARIGSTRPARAAAPRKAGPIVPDKRGDSLVVQFRFRGVQTVAIAGDWDGWKTHPLRSVGDDLWEGTFVLARGRYHFNLLVDGRKWVVPAGVATAPDGSGGMVGVLVVR